MVGIAHPTTILINKFPQLSIEEVRQMLNLKEADVTQTRFYQEVFQIGRQEGRQEGEHGDTST